MANVTFKEIYTMSMEDYITNNEPCGGTPYVNVVGVIGAPCRGKNHRLCAF
jgi:hypothetical protein